MQKFGKALLVVVAVMSAAGLMISIGKLIAMSVDISFINTLARVMEDIGWAIKEIFMCYLQLLLVDHGQKREQVVLLSFILINRITGAIFGVNTAILSNASATVNSLFGSELVVKNYFTNILGAPALNMGGFVGIISGFLGATLYNKYYNYNNLPKALDFFNGKRFVPFGLHHMLTVPVNYTELGEYIKY